MVRTASPWCQKRHLEGAHSGLPCSRPIAYTPSNRLFIQRQEHSDQKSVTLRATPAAFQPTCWNAARLGTTKDNYLTQRELDTTARYATSPA